MSIPETQIFVTDIVAQISSLENSPECDLPECTAEELWRKADVFKYYKDPNKKTRSTKNFDTLIEANTRLVKDGNIGIVDTFKGQVIRCRYCDVVGVCAQANSYLADGSLVL